MGAALPFDECSLCTDVGDAIVAVGSTLACVGTSLVGAICGPDAPGCAAAVGSLCESLATAIITDGKSPADACEDRGYC